jgi:hypothetical protein
MRQLMLMVPRATVERLWSKNQPGNYDRKVAIYDLIHVMILAFLYRLPSLRAICDKYGRRLHTTNPSTLAYNLRHPQLFNTLLDLLELLLVRRLSPSRSPRCKSIEPIDSMPVTIPATYRSDCPLFNNTTKGLGVLWSLRLNPDLKKPAVCLLRFLLGAYNDSFKIRRVALTPEGPLYLFDRGFYSIVTISLWIACKLRFVVRVKKKDLCFEVLEHLSRPRKLANGIRVELDARVRLGSPKRRKRPEVRLVKAWLPNGEDLFLATPELEIPVEDLVKCYGWREPIEKFHLLLKEHLCLAHLYNFQQVGMQIQVLLALLAALIAQRAATEEQQQAGLVWQVMLAVIKRWRASRGITTQYKANTTRTRRTAKKSSRASPTLAPAALGIT